VTGLDTKAQTTSAGVVPDVYTFGALVKSFVNGNRIDDAFVLFEKMKSAGMVPPEVCFLVSFGTNNRIFHLYVCFPSLSLLN
jgi:pentatricopeptide repeat protein